MSENSEKWDAIHKELDLIKKEVEYPLLKSEDPAEVNQKLFDAYIKLPDNDQKKLALEKVILDKNIGIVFKCIVKNANSAEDVQGYISDILLRALMCIRLYNPSKNTAFSTYLYISLNTVVCNIYSSTHSLKNIPQDKIISVSNNDPVQEDRSQFGHDLQEYQPVSDHMPENDIIKKDIYKIVLNSIEQLSPREKFVVKNYFGINCEPITMQQIGIKMGCKRQLVHTIYQRSMEKIKNNIAKKGIHADDLEFFK